MTRFHTDIRFVLLLIILLFTINKKIIVKLFLKQYLYLFEFSVQTGVTIAYIQFFCLANFEVAIQKKNNFSSKNVFLCLCHVCLILIASNF